MSGGEFNYNFEKLEIYKGQMEDLELNKLLVDFQNVLYELEWYKSGDTDEEDYRKAVTKFKNKWLGRSKEERIKSVIDEQTQELKQELYKCFDIKEEL